MRIFSKYSQATLVFLFFFGIIGHLKWLGGRVVMQRIANPWTPVRFRPQPPNFLLKLFNKLKKKSVDEY